MRSEESYRAKKEFNGEGTVVTYVQPMQTIKETTMKYTTIALAIAFTIPSTFALARGGMQIGSHVTRPFTSPVGTGRIANRPRNVTGNTLAPIAHDPSGSTINGSAMNRTGG